MHHAFKTWCIVSTSGRFAIKPPDLGGFSYFYELFEQVCILHSGLIQL